MEKNVWLKPIFFRACGGLYDSRSQNNIAWITSSESKLDTFRMNSSWELKEIAYAANENRAAVEFKAVRATSCKVIAYVWAGLSALSPDRADLTTLSPIGSSKWFDRGANKSEKWKNWSIPSQELIENDRNWVKWGHFGPPQARKFWGLGL
jgi:hypothetical protein